MIYHGDLFDVLPTLDAESIDACVCDPPYELSFMSKHWDRSGVAFRVETWREVYRVLKPGAYLLAFGGTRTFHRMTCAIEDAGFEIRDCLSWLYGSGFPKSLDVSKAIDARAEENSETKRRVALVAAVIRAHREAKGLERAEVSAAVVGTPSGACWNWEHQQLPSVEMWPDIKRVLDIPDKFDGLIHGDRALFIAAEREVIGARRPAGGQSGHTSSVGQHFIKYGSRDIVVTAPATDAAKQWQGWGTALKPSWEPIILARKPFKGTVAGNVLQHGTGALNIDACRIGTDAGWSYPNGRGGEGWHGRESLSKNLSESISAESGRWPANVLLDEWHEQVMYLKYNIPTDAACVIREYFSDYRELSAMQTAIRYVSEPSETGTGPAMQSSLLCGLAQRESAGRESSDERPEAPPRLDSEHESNTEGKQSHRPTQRRLEGRNASSAWLRDGVTNVDLGEGAAIVCTDGDSEQQALHPGAQASRSSQIGTSVIAIGNCASPEWQQAGQPLIESGDLRSDIAHTKSSGSQSGVASIETRERAAEIRTLEILESDIPRVWLGYFVATGKSVRHGAAALLDAQSGDCSSTRPDNPNSPIQRGGGDGMFGLGRTPTATTDYGDSGGASRFFYCAKPSREERDPNAHVRNNHPTVKPVELMRWLVRLVTPPNGICLDPFTGSGTTGMACRYEQRQFIGIEREAEYVQIAEARIAAVAPLFNDEPEVKRVEPQPSLWADTETDGAA